MCTKKLIIINGTMGVGKTATCQRLNKKLNKSAWLDADWCWMINPFIVNEENKRMAEDNMSYLLRNYLSNSSIEYVIFNWVIHTEEIMEMVLDWVKDYDLEIYKITLTCSKEALRERLLIDIENNFRQVNIIEKSLENQLLFEIQNTIKLDTSHISVEETVNTIIHIIN